MEDEKILKALKEAREKSKKRNFVQTWDLIINLRNIDLTKPENRFSGSVVLPYSKGKKARVCVIADTTAPKARELGVKVITKDELKNITKKDAKKLAKEYDYFLGEVTLMPQIGKILGPALGPRGKMPKPYPPTADLKSLIEMGERTFNINVKSPVIHGAVGNENMEDEKVVENIKAVLEFVEKKLPKGPQQIKDIYVKLTMGPAVKVK